MKVEQESSNNNMILKEKKAIPVTGCGGGHTCVSCEVQISSTYKK
jgi:ferredoxin